MSVTIPAGIRQAFLLKYAVNIFEKLFDYLQAAVSVSLLLQFILSSSSINFIYFFRQPEMPHVPPEYQCQQG